MQLENVGFTLYKLLSLLYSCVKGLRISENACELKSRNSLLHIIVLFLWDHFLKVTFFSTPDNLPHRV